MMYGWSLRSSSETLNIANQLSIFLPDFSELRYVTLSSPDEWVFPDVATAVGGIRGPGFPLPLQRRGKRDMVRPARGRLDEEPGDLAATGGRAVGPGGGRGQGPVPGHGKPRRLVGRGRGQQEKRSTLVQNAVQFDPRWASQSGLNINSSISVHLLLLMHQIIVDSTAKRQVLWAVRWKVTFTYRRLLLVGMVSLRRC